jgi:hypothetical protein
MKVGVYSGLGGREIDSSVGIAMERTGGNLGRSGVLIETL